MVCGGGGATQSAELPNVSAEVVPRPSPNGEVREGSEEGTTNLVPALFERGGVVHGNVAVLPIDLDRLVGASAFNLSLAWRKL